jgi:hypothetical protein
VVVAIIGAAWLVWLAGSDAAMVRSASQLMPAPIARAVSAGVEAVVLYTAPRRDGLRWIEVADPRTRKADKLEVARR